MKRDLKADSEQIQNFRSKWRQSTSLEEAWDIGEAWECFCREKAELWAELWLDQALAEKERADKAEALARELLKAMNDLLYEYEDLTLRLPCSTPVGQPIHYNSQAAKQAENLLTKYKEVLGGGGSPRAV